MISATHVGCSTARNKGSCSNRRPIKRAELEKRVPGALKSKLMEPSLFREYCDEFTREMNRLRMQDAPHWRQRIERELDTLLDLILKGGVAESF
jgi:site-specific DNA recombinase